MTPNEPRKPRRYVDGKGIPFSEYREHLPQRARDFPRIKRRKDKDVMAAFHQQWDFCFVTGVKRGKFGVKLEAHHLTEGTAGRADEPCNLIMLDRKVHDMVKTAKFPQGLLLWCKLRTDRANTDWVRLAILHGYFLPDLIVDQRIKQEFERNMGYQQLAPLPYIGGGTQQ